MHHMHTYVDSIVGKRAVFGFFSTTSASKIDKKTFYFTVILKEFPYKHCNFITHNTA